MTIHQLLEETRRELSAMLDFDYPDEKKIQSFIHSRQLALLEVVRGKVEGMKKKINRSIRSSLCNVCGLHIAAGECDCAGYNAALSDVLSALDEGRSKVGE